MLVLELNDTIKIQLNHRSIRHFKEQALDKKTITTLLEVARQTASSQFFQQFSIIHVTDGAKRKRLAEICNQPPVIQNGELFIFLIDLHRNQQLRKQAGLDDGRLHTMDLYLQGLSDATLAVQNMYVAAESLGLGGVILGSIRNDIAAVSELFDLPEMVIPALGLQIGLPAESSEKKPRLPLDLLVFENKYQSTLPKKVLEDYDQEVAAYYLNRQTNARKETFTNQITGSKSALNKHFTKRDEVLEQTHKQGFLWN